MTARLRLRPHRLDDFADSLALWSDPGVVRFIGGRPFTAEEVWSRLLRYHGLWPALGFGYWVIEDRQDGTFLGETGFADYHRDMTPSIAGLPEQGWVLAPTAHGRGLAREAITATLGWADEHLAAPETVCIIDPANTASLRLAAATGYGAPQPATYRAAGIMLLRRPSGASGGSQA